MREAAYILTCTPRVYLADYDFVLWASIGPRFLKYPKRASPSHGNWEKQITQTIHKGMFICCLKIFICCLKIFICCLKIFICCLKIFICCLRIFIFSLKFFCYKLCNMYYKLCNKNSPIRKGKLSAQKGKNIKQKRKIVIYDRIYFHTCYARLSYVKEFALIADLCVKMRRYLQRNTD